MIENGIRTFFNWWFLELNTFVPNWLRRLCLWRRYRLIGVLKRTEFALSAITGSHEQQLLRIRSNASEAAGDFCAVLERIKQRHQAVTLRVCGELGLRKLVDVPIAARNDLDNMLRYEMDRLSPFGSDNVCFAHRIVCVKPEERNISVEVEIVPREIIDRAVAIARRLGLEPSRLELAGGTSEAALNLLPHQASASTRRRRLDLALAVLALVSAGAAVVLPLHRQYATAADLDSKAITQKHEAEKTLMVLRQVDNLNSMLEFIFDRKRVTIMTVHVLSELTHLIPDEAYVEQLHIKDGEVRIHGYAHSVSDLIRFLEASPLFWKARFLSPITTDRHSGRERFQIAVGIRPADG